MPGYGIENFARDFDVSRETCRRLELFADLLIRWNRRVNLVSRHSAGDIWRRHIADSAQLCELIPPYDGALVDVGSGAGFPGMVLAIMGFGDVHLIESNTKKCAFLREAARITSAVVTIHNIRLDSDSTLNPAIPKAATVTARAVSPLANLLDIVFPIMYGRTCCIFPKGVHADEDLIEARRRWEFNVQQLPNKLEPGGVILKIRQVRRIEVPEAED